VLVVGHERIPVDPTRPDDRELLSSYVAAIRRQRGLGPGDPVTFRAADVAALAGVLDLTGDDLEPALRTAAGMNGPGARRTAQRLVLTALCVLAAGGATFAGSGFDVRPAATGTALAVRPEVSSPFTTRARSGPPAPERGPRLLFDVGAPGSSLRPGPGGGAAPA
jgi:hypothetical protein